MKEISLYADMQPGKVMDFFKVEEARVHDWRKINSEACERI